jgi:hypothetical protein
VIKSLIQRAARSPVQPLRDGWFRPRDERSGAKTSSTTDGGTSWTDGGDPQLSVAAVYVRLDTGETVLGSRRFKAAVAGIAERSKPAMAGTLGQAAE